MAPFDRSHTSSYWSAIVSIALSCAMFEFFTLNNIVSSKSGLEVLTQISSLRDLEVTQGH